MIKFLTKGLELSVKDWAVDFNPGQTILSEIVQASRDCRAGIFLFTKDDPLDGSNFALPRDNVLFEAGYFIAAKGKDRVVIIREEGAKMPADLGGEIYVSLKNRLDTASIETKLRQFIASAL